ncbi:MAG: hypothetical protein K2X38_03950 [Gemmataceae bacterium]|nr:hypothetical protein [Gemmataceae bacterium]
MELICPGCTKKLNIADQYAGQTVRCPLCSKMFQAPTLNPPVLAAAVVPPPPPPLTPIDFHAPSGPMTVPIPGPVSTIESSAPFAPPQDVFTFADGHGMHAPPPPPLLAQPLPAEATLRPLDAGYASRDMAANLAPEPVGPPGDFTKSIIWRVRPDILSWVTAISLAVIFLLSFFPWRLVTWELNSGPGWAGLWGLAFSDVDAVYILYAVFTVFIALPLAGVLLAIDKGWFPKVSAVAPVWPWRHAILGGILLLPLLLTGPYYLNALFLGNSLGVAQKLALRLHLVAVIALLLQFWLERRATRNLPLPRISIRW